MGGAAKSSTDPPLIDRCLSIDLEVDPVKAQIFSFAAVQRRADEKIVYRGGSRDSAFDRLEDLANSSDFLLGHNILRFDLPHLTSLRPRLAQLAAKAIDTLWLNPLAFPRNPITLWSSIITMGGCKLAMSTIRSLTHAWFSRCWRTRFQLLRHWPKKTQTLLLPITI
jgi:hypothetical protein